MITIKLKGKEYTLEEAQEIYEELDKIFARDRSPTWPAPTYPQYPQPAPDWPHWPQITWECDPAFIKDNEWYVVDYIPEQRTQKNFFWTTPTMETNPNGSLSDITMGMTQTDE